MTKLELTKLLETEWTHSNNWDISLERREIPGTDYVFHFPVYVSFYDEEDGSYENWELWLKELASDWNAWTEGILEKHVEKTEILLYAYEFLHAEVPSKNRIHIRSQKYDGIKNYNDVMINLIMHGTLDDCITTARDNDYTGTPQTIYGSDEVINGIPFDPWYVIEK